jgi:lipopolysaccharide/colanic/teichoic acid biosynthesis glycosyltransferase
METDVNTSFYARFGKPLLDRLVGLILAILTLPLVAVLLVMAWITFGWPPLSRQSRMGRGGRRFNLYRINTRKDYQTDLRGRNLRMSNWLRSTSLDELPQLWNVVLGHMSLVGPRPLDPVTALQLEQDAARRHGARPGLTGPWQLEARGDGRDLLEHIEVDLAYVEGISFGTDLVLLARTVPTLFRRREEV